MRRHSPLSTNSLLPARKELITLLLGALLLLLAFRATLVSSALTGEVESMRQGS